MELPMFCHFLPFLVPPSVIIRLSLGDNQGDAQERCQL